jgi:putative transcriptional regulator
MSAIKRVRDELGLTQTELAKELGRSQGSVSFYECGSIPIPPEAARKLIEFAASHGVELSFDDLYAAA